MTSPTADPDRLDAAQARRRGIQATMTAQLALRQFLLLFVAATAVLFMLFFINFYGVTFGYLWDRQPNIDLKIVSLPAILVLVYGVVLLNGVLFALAPSERSFGFFFTTMMAILLFVNWDHSVVDWFFKLFSPVQPRFKDPVSAFKILFVGLFMVVIVTMHYNILADDFARRMLRRGLPTDEVAQIRGGMFKVLIPTIVTAGALAFGLALLGELSALIFEQNPLPIPKLQLIVLAALVVPMAFLIRGILRDLTKRTGSEPPPGPNR